MGDVDRRAVEAVGLDVTVIDARGCLVCPGLIDPHQHLLGGSGEGGFATQTPEIALSEIVRAGITTVVGTLGVDTTMKTMAGLLAKVKGLREEGLGAAPTSAATATSSCSTRTSSTSCTSSPAARSWCATAGSWCASGS